MDQKLLDSTMRPFWDYLEMSVLIGGAVLCFARLMYLENRACKLLVTTLILSLVCAGGFALNLQNLTATLPYVEPTAPLYLMRTFAMGCLVWVGTLVFIWPMLRIWFVDDEPQRKPKEQAPIETPRPKAYPAANPPLDDADAFLREQSSASVVQLHGDRRGR
jgi:hypothetical protein